MRERGAGTVELIIATPLLMLLLFAIVQFAVWSHATHIAQAAAAQGLAATRTEGGTTSAGNAAAAEVLAQLGDGPLEGAVVDVTRDADGAAVRISGTAAPVVPFLNLPVHAEASGPVERWTVG
ncbi:TadE/TadG family type IV pilus assembly protein [Jiangella muralis]|uniref:TadE/TadG family type IV pilus assembly protein n=1 Tax=Jiangella muralis TaxID=702383 RepID=UPI00069EFC70|nr:TadE/TadG family type IV pilus assembly protein [Jiangella muralis]